MEEYSVKVYNEITKEIIDEFVLEFENINELYEFMSNELHNYDEEYYNTMKYTIYYSCPNDIQRYVIHAKDEKQLVTFLKMLTDEKAYNFQVEMNLND